MPIEAPPSDEQFVAERRARPAPQRAAAEPDARSLIQAIHALRRTAVHAGYWEQFCSLMRMLCRGRSAMVVQEEDGGGPAGAHGAADAAGLPDPAAPRWLRLGADGETADWLGEAWQQAGASIAERARANGFAFHPVRSASGASGIVVATTISGLDAALLLLDLPETERPRLNDLVVRAMLATDIAASPESTATAQGPGSAATAGPAAQQGGQLAVQRADGALLDMLDLVAQVMQKHHFGAAAMALVNGIAAHYGAAQVALGWQQPDKGFKTVAISHVAQFDRKSRHVQLMEQAFRETAFLRTEQWTQSTDEVLPQVAGSAAAASPQLELMDLNGFSRVVSLPVNEESGGVRAVVLLAFREDGGGAPPTMASLMLALDLLSPWLHDLYLRDRWWGRRLIGWMRKSLEKLIGPGHVWIKSGALVASALLLYGIFGTWPWRIDATSQITTDSIRQVSAQFDGRIDNVFVTAGDLVKAGTVLASLDVRDYRQQEGEVRADLRRFEAEVAKNRASGNLAEMEISLARVAQTEARLARIMDYINQANAVAPFDGVVVEGERKELMGAPVKKGDRLFRIAQTEGLYTVLSVPERDIRYIQPQATGEMYLLSRPDKKIPFKLNSVIPVAQVKGQEGNQFLISATLDQAPEPWWRPGMSGVARIDAGDHNILWIITHRTIDALRLRFWW